MSTEIIFNISIRPGTTEPAIPVSDIRVSDVFAKDSEDVVAEVTEALEEQIDGIYQLLLEQIQ